MHETIHDYTLIMINYIDVREDIFSIQRSSITSEADCIHQTHMNNLILLQENHL